MPTLNTKHAQELWERLPNTGETVASRSAQQAIRLIEHALRGAEQRGRVEAVAVAWIVLNHSRCEKSFQRSIGSVGAWMSFD